MPPPPGVDVLTRLATRINDHARHCYEQLPGGLKFRPGTPAARDLAAATSAGLPWTEVPLRGYLGFADLRLKVARDHLVGLVNLLAPPFTLFAWASVARQALEAAGRAYWLLDPDLDLHERVHRSLSEQLTSVQEQLDLCRVLPWVEHEPDQLTEGQQRILDEARILGVKAPKRLPSATKIASEVLQPDMATEGGAEAIYKVLCAASHGTPYATVSAYRDAGPADDPYSRTLKPYLEVHSVYHPIMGAVLAHLAAVARAVEYCGCEHPDQWWSWADKVALDLEEGLETAKGRK